MDIQTLMTRAGQLYKENKVVASVAIGFILCIGIASALNDSYALQGQPHQAVGVNTSAKRTLSDVHTVSFAELSSALMKDEQLIDAAIDVVDLKIDGVHQLYFESTSQAEQALDQIKAKYVDEENPPLEVSFVEDVTIEETAVSIFEFDSYSELVQSVQYLMTGTTETREYVIVKGDTISKIADDHQMTQQELMAANPELTKQKYLQIDQVINLVVPVPKLNVKVVQSESYPQAIDYEVIKEESEALYEGDSDIKIAGVPGEQTVVAHVEYINGVETAREVQSETVLREPISQVEIVGAKPLPPSKGSGSFMQPARAYRISSRFGVMRSTGRHTGIDLAMSYGSSIYAADGGVVTFAGYKGAYGYLVIIDHGARKSTYYAHNSELLVSQGQKVSKGQRIAYSGNSGRSTGPHLHFEVRIDGVPVNPTKYVGL